MSVTRFELATSGFHIILGSNLIMILWDQRSARLSYTDWKGCGPGGIRTLDLLVSSCHHAFALHMLLSGQIKANHSNQTELRAQSASAGIRTQVTSSTGSYTNHYTTEAYLMFYFGRYLNSFLEAMVPSFFCCSLWQHFPGSHLVYIFSFHKKAEPTSSHFYQTTYPY